MDIKDISWNLFALTGDIEMFLLYKRLEDASQRDDAAYEKESKPTKDERSRNTYY